MVTTAATAPTITLEERTQVAVIGGGPAGMLLAHLLDIRGVDSVVLEARSAEYVASRVRAGVLEQSTVDVLRDHGLGARLDAVGDEHHGIELQWPGQRHRIDLTGLTGRSVWVYGQTQVQRDLVEARAAAGQQAYYEITDTALHDIGTDSPSVTFTDAQGRERRVRADVVVGCDGSFGPSRQAIPDADRRTWQREYPFAWLGILADVAPSTSELIYAYHPDGFAMHSMRSRAVSRLYLQVPVGTDVGTWSDDRIWEALAVRLGHGQDGWTLTPGPITAKSVLPMRSVVTEPMRHGRLFLAGDAAHVVPPTGAKGLNLAVADVALLAPALADLVCRGDARLADGYSATALQRVWRTTHFSWWMTTMLHAADDPFDARLQQAQLLQVASSTAGETVLAQGYVGRPIGT